MTQIRPQTPEELDLTLGHLPATRPRSIRISGGTSLSAGSKDGELTRSLRSEPDIDTIMPLPGWGTAPHSAHAQMHNVVSASRSPEKMSDSLSSEEEEELGGGEDRPALHRHSSDFATIEHPFSSSGAFGNDFTAKALETCKTTVLRPYLFFLKVIGWRRLRSARYDLEPPLWQKVVNVAWPVILCALILLSCATQIVTCFRRDTVPIHPKVNDTYNKTYYDIKCKGHILTTFIIPDLLLFAAFVYGLYIFRLLQVEHLSTLTERVFLGYMSSRGKYSHKRLIRTLQFIICIGFLWILFSLVASIFKVFSHHLLDDDTKVEWIPSYKKGEERSNIFVRWVLVCISILGFVVLDFAYTAVVTNYCLQCQLIIYLLHSICDRMKSKEWQIDQLIKEIKDAREFLSSMNSHLARAMSLLLFIFLVICVDAYDGLRKVSNEDTNMTLEVVGGVLSAVQWTTILVFPLIQAARVTRACIKVKKTGLEVRSRPYSYKDTPQLDLDSLVIFTSGLNMSAKLVSVPMYPWIVVGGIFLTGFVFFLVFQYDSYSWAPWI